MAGMDQKFFLRTQIFLYDEIFETQKTLYWILPCDKGCRKGRRGDHSENES